MRGADIKAALQKKLAAKKAQEQPAPTAHIAPLPTANPAQFTLSSVDVVEAVENFVKEFYLHNFHKAPKPKDIENYRKNNLKSLQNQMVFFQHHESHGSFGVIIGTLLTHQELQDSLRGKNISPEIQQIIFPDSASVAAASASNPTKISVTKLAQSLVWTLNAKKFPPADNAEWQSWQTKMISQTAAKIIDLLQKNLTPKKLIKLESQTEGALPLTEALMLAATMYGDNDIIIKLIGIGVKIDPLSFGTSVSKPEIMQTFIANGCDVDAEFLLPNDPTPPRSPLLVAIFSKKFEAVRAICEKITRLPSDPNTLKIISTANDEIFEFLKTQPLLHDLMLSQEMLELRTKIKNTDLAFCTLGAKSLLSGEFIPMSEAERIKTLTTLLQDANLFGTINEIYLEDGVEYTLLSIAAENRCSSKIIELLLDHRADSQQQLINPRFKNKITPLLYAMKEDDPQTLGAFLKKGKITIDELIHLGSSAVTMLGFLSQGTNIDSIAFLLEQGANPNQTIIINGRKTTPLTLAISKFAMDIDSLSKSEQILTLQKQTAIIKMLIEHSTQLDRAIEYRVKPSQSPSGLLNLIPEEVFDKLSPKEKFLQPFCDEIKSAFAKKRTLEIPAAEITEQAAESAPASEPKALSAADLKRIAQQETAQNKAEQKRQVAEEVKRKAAENNLLTTLTDELIPDILQKPLQEVRNEEEEKIKTASIAALSKILVPIILDKSLHEVQNEEQTKLDLEAMKIAQQKAAEEAAIIKKAEERAARRTVREAAKQAAQEAEMARKAVEKNPHLNPDFEFDFRDLATLQRYGAFNPFIKSPQIDYNELKVTSNPTQPKNGGKLMGNENSRS